MLFPSMRRQLSLEHFRWPYTATANASSWDQLALHHELVVFARDSLTISASNKLPNHRAFLAAGTQTSRQPYRSRMHWGSKAS